MQVRSIPNLPNQTFRCLNHGASLLDPNPSFGGKKKQILDDHPCRKASKGRVHGKMSKRHPSNPPDYHAVIVSSAHGVVQCRIGDARSPVKRPSGALNQYWTTSADGRESAVSPRIDSLFQGVWVVVQGVGPGQSTDLASRIRIFGAAVHREASSRERYLSIRTRRRREGCAGATPLPAEFLPRFRPEHSSRRIDCFAWLTVDLRWLARARRSQSRRRLHSLNINLYETVG